MGSKDEFSYEWLPVGPACSTGPGTLETETAKLWRDRGSGRELGTPKQRDAFVRKLRRNKMFLGKKQFKEFIKSRYAEVHLSQIMLAYSKVVVAPQKPKPCMPVAEADKPYAVDWWPVGPVAEAQETPNTVDDPWSHLR